MRKLDGGRRFARKLLGEGQFLAVWSSPGDVET